MLAKRAAAAASSLIGERLLRAGSTNRIVLSKWLFRPDAVEKLDLSCASSADSLAVRHGRSGDDGTEADGAGRVVL